MKEYIVRTVERDAVEAFLKENAEQGYTFVTMVPVARMIKDTPEGTTETILVFSVLMERDTDG